MSTLAKLCARATRTPRGCLELPRQGSRRYVDVTVKELGRKLNAHKAVWILLHGPIPDGQWVCHSCDNGLCIEPSHLWLGTPTDNQMDCYYKRRNPTLGEDARMAKLTAEQVVEIRGRIQDGECDDSIALDQNRADMERVARVALPCPSIGARMTLTREQIEEAFVHLVAPMFPARFREWLAKLPLDLLWLEYRRATEWRWEFEI